MPPQFTAAAGPPDLNRLFFFYIPRLSGRNGGDPQASPRRLSRKHSVGWGAMLAVRPTINPPIMSARRGWLLLPMLHNLA